MINALLLSLMAGLSTTLGSLIIFFIKKPKDIYLNIAMGFSAGVMIFVSFVELLSESIEFLGYGYAVLSFFGGMLIIYLIDVFVPHSYEAENKCKIKKGNIKSLKRCSFLIAVGIAIHNFPEGIAVFFSSLVDIHLGIIIAIAIALHNIPEGIAVAMPIYYATKSKKKAFLYSFLSGIAEPIGAIVAWIFLQGVMNDTILNIILAMVAGIMIFISFDELLPRAYSQKNMHPIILGIFFGMGIMALSMAFV